LLSEISELLASEHGPVPEEYLAEARARRAGELLGQTGLSGHRCAIDAVVAATAFELERPVVLLTSDPDDLATLTEEPELPKAQRIIVTHG
jgi:hypothetical protein